jgi:hypothetical protein
MLMFCGATVAQRMEIPKERALGDRSVFSLMVNNKTKVIEEDWVGLTDTDMVGDHKIDGKSYEVLMTRSPPYQLRKGICYSSGQVCEFSPPVNLADFPLEKGKKWRNAYTVTGETFKEEVTEERTVEGVETIRVPAGEFETWKINVASRFKGRDNKGNSYSGRADTSMWVALVSGKMSFVKITTKSSSGDKLSRELVSASMQ